MYVRSSPEETYIIGITFRTIDINDAGLVNGMISTLMSTIMTT